LDLKNARDRLTRYRNKLEADEQRVIARAKQYKEKGDTKNALNLLRIRKIKQKEVDTAEGQLLNVMQMLQTIDSKQNEVQLLQAMKVGKDTLQRMHEETTVDDVLELMDEIKEQHELEREMNSIFEGVPELSVEDEAAVEAELEALMGGTEQLPVAPTTKPLPTAPTTKPSAAVPTETPVVEEKVAVAS
jgi:uncharacterized protein YegP (UPF0339 family)